MWVFAANSCSSRQPREQPFGVKSRRSIPIYPFMARSLWRTVWRCSWDSRFYGVLFLIFAAIALLLASIGLYTVIAHSVSQRTQEIGIRMAVGATARDILKLVFVQGMLPLGIGLTIGLAASFAVNRLLESSWSRFHLPIRSRSWSHPRFDFLRDAGLSDSRPPRDARRSCRGLAPRVIFTNPAS